VSAPLTAVAVRTGRFGFIPFAIAADLLAVGAFSVNENVAAGIGALVSTVLLIWAIINWVDNRIAASLKHHNELIVEKLKLQDKTAETNQSLLLEKIAGVTKQLEHTARRH
jgi:hypothetical protein